MKPSIVELRLPLPVQLTTLAPAASMTDSPVPLSAGFASGSAGTPAFAPRRVRFALLMVIGPA